jgi:hypothetical protein
MRLCRYWASIIEPANPTDQQLQELRGRASALSREEVEVTSDSFGRTKVQFYLYAEDEHDALNKGDEVMRFTAKTFEQGADCAPLPRL